MINHPGIYIAIGVIALITVQYLSWLLFNTWQHRKALRRRVDPVKINRWWFLVLSHHLASDLIEGIVGPSEVDMLRERARFHIGKRMTTHPSLVPIGPGAWETVVELAICTARLIHSQHLAKKGDLL